MSGVPDDIAARLIGKVRDMRKAAQAAEDRAEAVTQTNFLSREVAALLTQQVGKELFSYYVYLGVANWFADLGLDGFGCFMRKAADEELKHMLKVNDYLVDTNNRPVLPAIEAPTTDFESATAAVQAVLDHEMSVTADWKKIHSQAVQDVDPATIDLAQWFGTEQVEEEDKAMKLLQRLKMAGDGAALVLLDHSLK